MCTGLVWPKRQLLRIAWYWLSKLWSTPTNNWCAQHCAFSPKPSIFILVTMPRRLPSRKSLTARSLSSAESDPDTSTEPGIALHNASHSSFSWPHTSHCSLSELTNSDSEQWLVWGQMNDECEALCKAIPGSVDVSGSDSAD